MKSYLCVILLTITYSLLSGNVGRAQTVSVDQSFANNTVPYDGLTLPAKGTPSNSGDCLVYDWKDVTTGIDYGSGEAISNLENDFTFYPSGQDWGKIVTLGVTVTDKTTNTKSPQTTITVVVPLLKATVLGNFSYYGGTSYDPGGYGGNQYTDLKLNITPDPVGTNTTYFISANNSKVSFPASVSTSSFFITSQAPSATQDDIDVMLTGDSNEVCADDTVTVFEPQSIAVSTITLSGTADIFGYKGWDDLYQYSIKDQMTPPAEVFVNTPVNESFGTRTDPVYDFDWPSGAEVNDTTPIQDHYSVPPNTYRNPQPVWYLDPGYSTNVFSRPQTYKTGSLTSGVGLFLTTCTLNFDRGWAERK